MEVNPLAEAFTHLIEGYDIPVPESFLKVRKERAAVKKDSLPYSLLTNLHHTVVWQTYWLKKLRKEPRLAGPELFKMNWHIPDADEWEALRTQFVEGLHEAREFARNDADPDTLSRILVHAAYHVGQMYLLKRAKV